MRFQFKKVYRHQFGKGLTIWALALVAVGCGKSKRSSEKLDFPSLFKDSTVEELYSAGKGYRQKLRLEISNVWCYAGVSILEDLAKNGEHRSLEEQWLSICGPGDAYCKMDAIDEIFSDKTYGELMGIELSLNFRKRK